MQRAADAALPAKLRPLRVPSGSAGHSHLALPPASAGDGTAAEADDR